MIPFQPEPLDRLRSRYAEAVRPVIDPEIAALGVQERPGESRRLVFDCEDGLRLIVSRDAISHPTIHLSASLCPNTTVWERHAYLARRRGAVAALDRLRTDAVVRFREISGEDRPLRYLGVLSSKGISLRIVVDR